MLYDFNYANKIYNIMLLNCNIQDLIFLGFVSKLGFGF